MKNVQSTIHAALKVADETLMTAFGGVQAYTVKEHHASIVTETDLESERAIKEVLLKAFPTFGYIGEETGYQPGKSEYTWVVDPIDGTSNFAAGLPWFGTLIALLDREKPVAAGASIPCYHKLYYAEHGMGAFCNEERLKISPEKNLRNILVGYGMDCSEDQLRIDREVSLFGRLIQETRNMRLLNCLVDQCFVAEGKIGAIINHNVKIWDYAAPYLLMVEAGGMATTIEGKPLNFRATAPDLLDNHTIVAANTFLHRQIIQIINEVWREIK